MEVKMKSGRIMPVSDDRLGFVAKKPFMFFISVARTKQILYMGNFLSGTGTAKQQLSPLQNYITSQNEVTLKIYQVGCLI